MLSMKSLVDSQGTTIYFTGISPEEGPLPALFYFALSGEESLTLSPYNTPATLLKDAHVRVFSLTLPGHGPGFDKLHAMHYWTSHLDTLKTFFDTTTFAIDWLIREGIADPAHLAAGGLSRGGFIATHLAAREKRIKTILGFSPLTRLSSLKEFASPELSMHVKVAAAALDLEHLVSQLTHLHALRFYVGNRDERVGTDACFHFIRRLADQGHKSRSRHMNIELNVTHSIGHQGHGTSPHVFEEGTNWLKKNL